MSEYVAPAFEAVVDLPVLTMRDGRRFTGRPLAFGPAVRFNKRWRELVAAQDGEGSYSFACDVLTAMGLPADEVLEDLTESEVFAALAGFFVSQRKSSESVTTAETTTTTTPASPGTSDGTPSLPPTPPPST